jgi:dTDP-4-amino-4,6-dideoxy-D-galactose acyltransferase
MKELQSILEQKGKSLGDYSPYSFMRNVDRLALARQTVLEPLFEAIAKNEIQVCTVVENGEAHHFAYKKLAWDTAYFGFPILSLMHVVFSHQSVVIAARAIRQFNRQVVASGSYVWCNVPAEDLILVQALCLGGFCLVETRLNYCLESLPPSGEKNGFTRFAVADDIPRLREVASLSRNPFDRVHADTAFTKEQADAYLATFAESAVKGFADYVLVPNVSSLGAFGFLAANNPISAMGVNVAKLVLAAVDSTVQTGWLSILLQECIRISKAKGAEILTTITQASNKPAIRVWEKAGFRLGSTSHVFSFKCDLDSHSSLEASK